MEGAPQTGMEGAPQPPLRIVTVMSGEQLLAEAFAFAADHITTHLHLVPADDALRGALEDLAARHLVQFEQRAAEAP